MTEKASKRALFLIFICIYQKIVVSLQPNLISLSMANLKSIRLRYIAVVVFMACATGMFAQAITVAEALTKAEGLQHDETTTESYTIEGYVNVIVNNDFNTTYNNMTFWIADTRGNVSTTAAGGLQVYRGRPTVELQQGDKISVTAQLKNYHEIIETYPTNAPVTLLEANPDTPVDPDPQRQGNLRVCAQNLENYYYNYSESERPDYNDDAGFREKTVKIVNAMLDIDADIFAFCEVEGKEMVVAQLADSMNAHAGVAGRYKPVYDGINNENNPQYDNNLKSCFIYRADRVKTYGNNSAASNVNYYRNTMRIQAFELLSNGERLVVSMNHFKAKDSSADAGESQRQSNANSLVNALKKVTSDPDILVLGDLNCEYGEAPIQTIVDAGYSEQLLRFDPYAYSHCYGGGELIDHVLANTTMEQQVLNAYVKHVCTYRCTSSVSRSDSYSDHDPYIVEIQLGEPQSTNSIQPTVVRVQKVMRNGQLYLMYDGQMYDVRGVRVQ